MLFEKMWKEAKSDYDDELKSRKKKLVKVEKKLEKIKKEVKKLSKAGREDIVDSRELKKVSAEQSELITKVAELFLPDRKVTGLQPALKDLDKILLVGAKMIAKGIDKDKKDKWKPYAVLLQNGVKKFVVAHKKFEKSMAGHTQLRDVAGLIREETDIKRALDRKLGAIGKYLTGKNW